MVFTLLIEVITHIFNAILKPGADMPADWRSTVITEPLRKGDPQLPQNYRPVSVLPIMYKLCGRVLRERLKKYLACAQSVDQAGFKSGFSCEDHLLVLPLLTEASAEWNKEF